ncbi:hypothetical protein [Maribacter sp. 4G9]|uniref:hypothetical protein n=1 Tax=Maribacter sp. 4G9 TaxID=1889777 RepID=UPI000C15E02C|nr:hypothetical protein [Maribacter sp. 4G9]PIB23350.1 hypothetical protein BFP75_10085 [Maribacter sp. 4G9]
MNKKDDAYKFVNGKTHSELSERDIREISAIVKEITTDGFAEKALFFFNKVVSENNFFESRLRDSYNRSMLISKLKTKYPTKYRLISSRILNLEISAPQ